MHVGFENLRVKLLNAVKANPNTARTTETFVEVTVLTSC